QRLSLAGKMSFVGVDVGLILDLVFSIMITYQIRKNLIRKLARLRIRPALRLEHQSCPHEQGWPRNYRGARSLTRLPSHTGRTFETNMQDTCCGWHAKAELGLKLISLATIYRTFGWDR